MATKTINVGMCFSREFQGGAPLDHIGVKLPTYLRLLSLCQEKGWGAYVLTRRTYKGNGIFDGVWEFDGKKFLRVEKPVKIDLVYDRSAGVRFPPEGDESVVWVNNRDFKVLAWDKWAAYKEIGEYMPQTLLVSEEKDIPLVVPKIKTDWVVLKPFNGLKGIGVFIGTKEEALTFNFPKNFPKYIAQEFIDTSGGIDGVVPGMHDIRVAVVNGEIVWAHVRIPPEGSFKANAATGGTLTELDINLIPENIVEIVNKVSKKFHGEYDNPIYSLDFGIDKADTPKIFEINDQIGFPKWEMKNRDNFLKSLVANFSEKLGNKHR
jgi:glutathione synthase/RimK-type ligase-like ATP-grasp enzyme